MFIAHKREDDGTEQSVKEHLEGTAKQAAGFAKSFHAEKFGYLVGLCHDLGKYSPEFQRRIAGENIRADHSTAGAQWVNTRKPMMGKLLAFCIAGHHGGLPNGGTTADDGESNTLNGRLKKDVKDFSCYENEMNLEKHLELAKLPIKPIKGKGFSISFFVRMLYSCLVDGDYLDTEEFMSEGKIQRGNGTSITSLSQKFNEYVDAFAKTDTPINKKRTEILNCCLEKAQLPSGVFKLSVPTGAGKTLASMAFAVNHAEKNNMERVIYVIPYTSIIEQNAKVFKDILGESNVLEHHSNFDFADDENKMLNIQKRAAENWDMPIIVTTNVQFFESLYGSKSAKCRKLHNIANSVIIFDEVQVLPKHLLKPCLFSICELAENYGSTVLLSTATQPPLEKYFPKQMEFLDICSSLEGLSQTFKRTEIKQVGKMSNEELADVFKAEKQVLCIVNTRKHALDLFDQVQGDSFAFHLSTLMCPIHRRGVLEKIRFALKNGEDCKVISTQLIEAGVDLDFPVVYRSMAGTDSIVQAAGRCNREGTRSMGTVFVFEPEGKYSNSLPATLKLPIEIAKSITRNYENIVSEHAVSRYFDELYSAGGPESLDGGNFVEAFESKARTLDFPFKDVSEKFRFIDANTVPLVVPLDDRAELELEKIKYAGVSKKALRKLQPYTVNIYEHEFEALQSQNKIRYENEIAVLGDLEFYDSNKGIKIQAEKGIAVFI